jgi:hypothetical protein
MPIISCVLDASVLVELASAFARSGADAGLAEQVVATYRQRPDLELVAVDEALADAAVTMRAVRCHHMDAR